MVKSLKHLLPRQHGRRFGLFDDGALRGGGFLFGRVASRRWNNCPQNTRRASKVARPSSSISVSTRSGKLWGCAQGGERPRVKISGRTHRPTGAAYEFDRRPNWKKDFE
jgi:hypothetical protein